MSHVNTFSKYKHYLQHNETVKYSDIYYLQDKITYNNIASCTCLYFYYCNNYYFVYHRRIQQAALKAYRVAVQHLTIPSVCAACVAFTEMLGLDSTALRVDIQAADRLLAHAGLEDLLGDDAKEGNTMEDAIGNCVNLAFISARTNHFKL